MTTLRDRVAMVAMVVWSAALLAYAYASGSRGDYVFYVEIWKLVRAGTDPWAEFPESSGISNNTYGPLFNVLGYVPGELGPKLLMAGAFVAVNLLVLHALLRTRPSDATLVVYALVVPLSFLVVAVVGRYGTNDTLSAALIGAAMLARFGRRMVWVGVLLGLAVLLKLYPVVLVLFFCLDRRRVTLRPLLIAAATAAAGVLVTLVVWGSGFTAALDEGASRSPKLLSVLRAWESHPGLAGHSFLVDWAIRYNSVLIAVAVAAVLAVAWWLRLSWIESTTIALMVLLLTYKVGHPQLWLPFLFLVVGLLIDGSPRARWLAWCCVPFVVVLSLYVLGYAWITDGYVTEGFRIRRDGGFVAFGLGVATLAVFFAGMAWRPRTLGTDAPQPVAARARTDD